MSQETIFTESTKEQIEKQWNAVATHPSFRGFRYTLTFKSACVSHEDNEHAVSVGYDNPAPKPPQPEQFTAIETKP